MALNLANCSTNGNTGAPDCAFIPAQVKYWMLFPKGTIVPATSFATQAAFLTYMQGVIWNNLRSGRVQIIPELSDVTDKSKEFITVEHDNRTIPVIDTPYNLMAQLWQGSNGVSKWMHGQFYKNFSNQTAVYDIVMVDINGAFWFTSLGTTNYGDAKVLNLTTFIIEKWKMQDYKDANVYPLRIMLGDPKELNGYEAFYTPAQSADYWYSIALVDVVMQGHTNVSTVTSPNSTTHIYVTGFVGGGSQSQGAQTLGLTYGTGLDTASYWAVNDMAGGGAVVPSAVTYNATLDLYDLTGVFTTGHTYLVGLAAPSVVTAAGIYAITEGTVANPQNKVQCVIP